MVISLSGISRCKACPAGTHGIIVAYVKEQIIESALPRSVDGTCIVSYAELIPRRGCVCT
eukprot:754694-Hanusia_phi.AAC.12